MNNALHGAMRYHALCEKEASLRQDIVELEMSGHSDIKASFESMLKLALAEKQDLRRFLESVPL